VFVNRIPSAALVGLDAAAAGAAADTPPSSDLAAKMATATPAGALRMVLSK
jgi:hypothetical protein